MVLVIAGSRTGGTNMTGGDAGVIEIRPVGVVRGGSRQPILALRGGELHMGDMHASQGASAWQEPEIVIFDEYADCLDGIEEFSHVIVLYWSHMAAERGRGVRKVHPAGQKDLEMVGVFSTRSPARPNPICATTVALLAREGNVLEVRGLDAIDGSPVLDLKPHLPSFDAPEDVKLADWMVELMHRFASGQV
ncbi:MAG: tRNA (N6-threonylcarbamoyladenosine(37)-N6)-methyltransferase TrmO [Actinobacteria bacterium]|nr:tRNA (N6-threonylcarbamoyladenosine(37)-N6)-methyltransferase TrmO [Actinomycetota bacterium]